MEAADLVNRLIQRKPVNRIGLNGPDEVKKHPWFKNFPWEQLYKKDLEAPFIPLGEDNYHVNTTKKDTDNAPEKERENALLLRRNSIQSLFEGYQYDQSQKPIANGTTNISTRFNSINSNTLTGNRKLSSK